MKLSVFKRLLLGILVCSFLLTSIFPNQAVAQTVFNLPPPGTVITLSQPFTPPLVRGLTLYPDNPLKFHFIVDVGDDQLQGEAFQQESMKLIKYFLVSLTVPENDMWVNLSPAEKNRIIPDHFGKTEMGRDLLLQDYILKQLTASLMNPDEKLGKEFWEKVFQQSKDKFGTTDIPADTFNKIWIVPDKAEVYIKGQSVYVVNSHLKVMTEEDYFISKNQNSKNSDNKIQTQLMKEIIIPAIEKEVNEGKNFALLRQIQNSAVLAAWYKKNLKETLLGKVYVDQKKTNGISSSDKDAAQKIYNQYLESFKNGIYSFVKDDYNPATQEIISRKYISGGISTIEPVQEADSGPSAEKQLANQVRNPLHEVVWGLNNTANEIPDISGIEELVDGALYIPSSLDETPQVTLDNAMLITPQNQPPFSAEEFRQHKTAIYPGYFYQFDELGIDVIKESLKVFDRMVLVVLTTDDRIRASVLEKTVSRVYDIAKQLLTPEEFAKITIIGFPQRKEVYNFIQDAQIKGMVRKFAMVEPEGKLDAEAETSRINYEEYGLQTIFALPSYKFLQLPEDDAAVKKFDSYRKLLTNLLKQKFPQDPMYETTLTREQFETLVKEKSLSELLGEQTPEVDPNVAFYAGSFDPLTNGHLEALRQAANIYKKIYIGMGVNPDKKYLFSTEQRKELIEESLRNAGLTNFEVVAYQGMTVTEAARVGAGTLIRGARNVVDLKDELILAWVNQILNPNLRTILVTPHEHEDVSSSKVKADLAAGKNIATLVSAPVLWELLKSNIEEVKKDTKIIGLVGGIGTGKSTVLKELQKQSKIETIDLDKVGHEVLKLEDVKESLVQKFGDQILTDGEIDRIKLREIVFANDVNRRRLQNIVSPHILWRAYQKIFEIKAADPNVEAIVLEGIGIVEASMQRMMDEIWFVDTPAETRIERALADTARSALTRAGVEQIIAKQVPILERAKAKATYVIDNSKDQLYLSRQITALLKKSHEQAKIQYLNTKWQDILSRVGIEDSNNSVFNQIIAKYSEFNRYYHSVTHIFSIFKIFDQLVAEGALDETLRTSSNDDLVAFFLTIFLHDVIYEARRDGLDEDDSIAFTQELLSSLKLNQSMIDRVKFMIGLTKEHDREKIANDPLAQLFLDLDLIILGTDWETFFKYDRNIRKEFKQRYPINEFIFGRIAILTGLTSVEDIYQHPVIRERFNQKAKDNVKRIAQDLSDVFGAYKILDHIWEAALDLPNQESQIKQEFKDLFERHYETGKTGDQFKRMVRIIENSSTAVGSEFKNEKIIALFYSNLFSPEETEDLIVYAKTQLKSMGVPEDFTDRVLQMIKLLQNFNHHANPLWIQETVEFVKEINLDLIMDLKKTSLKEFASKRRLTPIRGEDLRTLIADLKKTDVVYVGADRVLARWEALRGLTDQSVGYKTLNGEILLSDSAMTVSSFQKLGDPDENVRREAVQTLIKLARSEKGIQKIQENAEIIIGHLSNENQDVRRDVLSFLGDEAVLEKIMWTGLGHFYAVMAVWVDEIPSFSGIARSRMNPRLMVDHLRGILLSLSDDNFPNHKKTAQWVIEKLEENPEAKSQLRRAVFDQLRDLSSGFLAQYSVDVLKGLDQFETGRRVLREVAESVIKNFVQKQQRSADVLERNILSDILTLNAQSETLVEIMQESGVTPVSLGYGEGFTWKQVALLGRAFSTVKQDLDYSFKLSLGAKAVLFQKLIQEVKAADETVNVNEIALRWFHHLVRIEQMDKDENLPMVSVTLRISVRNLQERERLRELAGRFMRGVDDNKIKDFGESTDSDYFDLNLLPAYPSVVNILMDEIFKDPQVKELQDGITVFINYSQSANLAEKTIPIYLASFFKDMIDAYLNQPAGKLAVDPQLTRTYEAKQGALGGDHEITLVRDFERDLTFFPLWHSRGVVWSSHTAPVVLDTFQTEIRHLARLAAAALDENPEAMSKLSEAFDAWIDSLNDPLASAGKEAVKSAVQDLQELLKKLQEVKGSHELAIRDTAAAEKHVNQADEAIQRESVAELGQALMHLMRIFGLTDQVLIGEEKPVEDERGRTFWQERLKVLEGILNTAVTQEKTQSVPDERVQASIEAYKSGRDLKSLDSGYARVEASRKTLIEESILGVQPKGNEAQQKRMMKLLDLGGEQSTERLFQLLSETADPKVRAGIFDMLKKANDNQGLVDYGQMRRAEMKRHEEGSEEEKGRSFGGNIMARAIHMAVSLGDDLKEDSLPVQLLRYLDPIGRKMTRTILLMYTEDAVKPGTDEETKLMRLLQAFKSEGHSIIPGLVDQVLEPDSRGPKRGEKYAVQDDNQDLMRLYRWLYKFDPDGKEINARLDDPDAISKDFVSQQADWRPFQRSLKFGEGARLRKELAVEVIGKTGESWRNHGLIRLMGIRHPKLKEELDRAQLGDAAMTGKILDFQDLPSTENPGQYPYTQGIHSSFRTGVEYPYWTPRQYAGFNTARETNERFRSLSDNNFSLAFSNSTQIGMDSDDTLALYNIGEEGAPIDTMEDLKTVFEGIDILSPEVSTSMTINASAAILQSMYYAVAMKRLMSEKGMSKTEALAWVRKNIRGTTQNDNVKERSIRNNFGISEAGSSRLTNDMIEFNAGSRWNTISVSGYHMREAGASDIQEVAFTIRNAMFYAKNFINNQREGSNVTIDQVLQQLPFFFDSYLFEETGEDFLREVAKFRAARRLWAKIAKHEFGATDDKALKMRFHSQTSGVPLESDPTGKQEMLNVVRIMFEALAAIYGGTQTLHIDSYDEPVRLPTEHSVRIAKESHALLLKILGPDMPVDPLSKGGTELLRKHVTEIQAGAFELIRREMSFKDTSWTPELEDFLRKSIKEEVIDRLGSLDNAQDRLDQYTDEIEQSSWQLIQELQQMEKSRGAENVVAHMRAQIQSTAYAKFITQKQRLDRDKQDKKERVFIGSDGTLTLKEMTGDKFEVLRQADKVVSPIEITDAMLEEKVGLYAGRQQEVLTHLRDFKAGRDQQELRRTLDELQTSAEGNVNVMPQIIDAVLAGATVGEIMQIFRTTFGEYQQNEPVQINRPGEIKVIQSKQRIKILTAKPGLDGHDRGLNIITMAFRNAGVEVVYGGIRQTPQTLVSAAIQEDVDFIAISSMSGALTNFIAELMAELKKQNATEIKVIVGGITKDDGPYLSKLGVAGIFDPNLDSDVLSKAVDFLQEWADRNIGRDEAMTIKNEKTPPIQREGGIDLNTNEKTLQERGDKIQLPVLPNPADWQNFQTNEFIPVIIHISPPVSLPFLLGAQANKDKDALSLATP